MPPLVRALSFLLALPLSALGVTVVEDGHIDLNPSYTQATDEWRLYSHHRAPGDTVVSDTPIEEVAYHVDDNAKVVSPGGAFAFIGPDGSEAWLIPQVQEPNIPWLGFGAYGHGGSQSSGTGELAVFDPRPDLTGNSGPAIIVSLVGVEGPAGARFALWQDDAFGQPRLFLSNQSGYGAPNFIALVNGQHAHFNWAFSHPGRYRILLRLSATIGGVPTESDPFPVAFIIGPLSAYETWRNLHFTGPELADDALSGAEADADGDGLSNFLEYALGGLPRDPTSAPAPQGAMDAGKLALQFTRIADPDLRYEVEASPDLAGWDAIWSSTGAENTAGPVTVSAPAPLTPAAPRSFLRLRVGFAD